MQGNLQSATELRWRIIWVARDLGFSQRPVLHLGRERVRRLRRVFNPTTAPRYAGLTRPVAFPELVAWEKPDVG